MLINVHYQKKRLGSELEGKSERLLREKYDEINNIKYLLALKK